MRISDNPVVALNHAVAVVMAEARRQVSDSSTSSQADDRSADDHRFHAVLVVLYCVWVITVAWQPVKLRGIAIAAEC